MSIETYDESLRRLLEHEGGYTNHPSDPGGPTNFGITIFDYRKYVKPKGTADDVRFMTLQQAKDIYRAKYWDAQHCSALPAGVDYAVFDYGVNSGIGRSGRVLRRCLKITDESSEVTPAVILAANAANAQDLIGAICDERIHFLHNLKTWPVFGAGWGRRVTEVRAISLRMAAGVPMIGSPSLVPAQSRAIDPDDHARIRALQQALHDKGFDPGAIDGDIGPKTIKTFQRANNLNPDGVVGNLTRPLLAAALAAAQPIQTGVAHA